MPHPGLAVPIEGVALRQTGRLREDLIWEELEPLLELKDSPRRPLG
ncbi:MAG TPA: hypothetical protein VMR21_12890 [Vicinamibacteria bacterium]|nr:hypothetical protein [Vicinamibacteria bacterium]